MTQLMFFIIIIVMMKEFSQLVCLRSVRKKKNTMEESAVSILQGKKVTFSARLMGLIQIALTVLWIYWPWTLQSKKTR